MKYRFVDLKVQMCFLVLTIFARTHFRKIEGPISRNKIFVISYEKREKKKIMHGNRKYWQQEAFVIKRLTYVILLI